MARRNHPETGVLQEEDSIFGVTYWTDVKNADGKSERIDPDTGVVQQESFLGWSDKKDENGNSERINIHSGVHEKEGWGLSSTWKPDKGGESNASARRNDPKTGVLQEEGLFGWTDIKDKDGNSSRVNPESGIYEEQDTVCGVKYWVAKPEKTNKVFGEPPSASDYTPSTDTGSSSSGDSRVHVTTVRGVEGTSPGNTANGFGIFLFLSGLFMLSALASNNKKTSQSIAPLFLAWLLIFGGVVSLVILLSSDKKEAVEKAVVTNTSAHKIGGSVVPENIPGTHVSGGTTANDTTLIGEGDQSAEDAVASGSSDVVTSGKSEEPNVYYPPVPLSPPIVQNPQMVDPQTGYVPPQSVRHVDGVAERIEQRYDAFSGRLLEGSIIFVLLDDGSRTNITLESDMYVIHQGEHVRMYLAGNSPISILKLVGD